MELKDRLAELRRSRGYSLRDLREQIEQRTGEKMAISYLSALERVGRTPSVESLTRIAAGYDMSLAELLAPLDGERPPSPSQLPQGFEAFAKKRNLSDVEKEAFLALEYRGNRPETEEEWDLLYSALNSALNVIGKRRNNE